MGILIQPASQCRLSRTAVMHCGTAYPPIGPPPREHDAVDELRITLGLRKCRVQNQMKLRSMPKFIGAISTLAVAYVTLNCKMTCLFTRATNFVFDPVIGKVPIWTFLSMWEFFNTYKMTDL